MRTRFQRGALGGPDQGGGNLLVVTNGDVGDKVGAGASQHGWLVLADPDGQSHVCAKVKKKRRKKNRKSVSEKSIRGSLHGTKPRKREKAKPKKKKKKKRRRKEKTEKDTKTSTKTLEIQTGEKKSRSFFSVLDLGK